MSCSGTNTTTTKKKQQQQLRVKLNQDNRTSILVCESYFLCILNCFFLLFYTFIIQYDFVRTRAVDRVIEVNCSDFEI